jgi:hypothetical protein
VRFGTTGPGPRWTCRTLSQAPKPDKHHRAERITASHGGWDPELPRGGGSFLDEVRGLLSRVRPGARRARETTRGPSTLARAATMRSRRKTASPESASSALARAQGGLLNPVRH